MFRGLATVLLLVVSNAFMTLAWYGHIAFKSRLERLGLTAIVLLSWGIAVRILLQVPATASAAPRFSIWELKVIQEVVSLSVFTVFALVFMKSDTLRWNHLAPGFLCLVLAVYSFSINGASSSAFPPRISGKARRIVSAGHSHHFIASRLSTVAGSKRSLMTLAGTPPTMA